MKDEHGLDDTDEEASSVRKNVDGNSDAEFLVGHSSEEDVEAGKAECASDVEGDARDCAHRVTPDACCHR